MIQNLFGTDGIRGTIGTHPFTLEHLPHLGNAIGSWAVEKYGKKCRILLAHDTRESSALLKAALQSGILLHPVCLYDSEILPTPAVCSLTQKSCIYDCGIVLSASHNPYQDNGIKIVNAQTGKISLEDEIKISSLFHASSFEHASYTSLGFYQNIADAVAQDYVEYILEFFKPKFLTGKKIVVDCANGAFYQLAPRIFQLLGATTITLHNEPDGTNINYQCGAVHPQALQKEVVRQQADVGLAFDGDGDRLIAVSASGEIKDGDDILALLLSHPLYKDTAALVGTDMTNKGFENYVAALGKQLIRSSVGDKYVSQKLEQENLILGGEQSGHIIMRDYLDTGDGLFTALRLLEVLQSTNNWEMATFTKFPQILINVPVSRKKDLTAQPFAQLIAESSVQLNTGRILVRYSGTENLLRIMIEDRELAHAQQIGTALSQALQKELS